MRRQSSSGRKPARYEYVASSAIPMATASPWPRRCAVSCSSLCADQWPKSSGRDEPSSNGSPPVAMWVEVERGAPADHLLHRAEIARPERRCQLLDQIEERAVLDQRRLDRLRDAGAPFAIRQRLQELGVVDDGKRRRERAEIVLLPEGVDAVLHAHRRVVLRQHRGRHADQANPAVRGRGGVARRHRARRRRQSRSRRSGGTARRR